MGRIATQQEIESECKRLLNIITVKRNEQNLSIADLAKKVGIKESLLQDIENNVVMPKIDLLVRIYDALGVYNK